MRMILIPAGLALALAAPAFGLIYGGSNLGYTGYPEPSCYVPSKPWSGSDRWEWNNYRNDANDYIDCINEYVESADSDIKRIKQAVDEAISTAKLNLS